MDVVRHLTLEELPPVLVLHLKFFVYDKDGGSQKLLKNFEYGIDLEITKGKEKELSRISNLYTVVVCLQTHFICK